VKQVRRERPVYPRVFCCIPGCKRSTTRIAPPCESVICGSCWRRAPKHLRDYYSRFSRRLTIARKRNSDRVALLEHVVDQAFRRVWKALLEQPLGDDIPTLMREQLRKDGLL